MNQKTLLTILTKLENMKILDIKLDFDSFKKNLIAKLLPRVVLKSKTNLKFQNLIFDSF